MSHGGNYEVQFVAYHFSPIRVLGLAICLFILAKYGVKTNVFLAFLLSLGLALFVEIIAGVSQLQIVSMEHLGVNSLVDPNFKISAIAVVLLVLAMARFIFRQPWVMATALSFLIGGIWFYAAFFATAFRKQ